MKRFAALALLLGLIITGYNSTKQAEDPGQIVGTVGNPVALETAIEWAEEQTPLKEVTRTQTSGVLPITHVITGTDDEGKELVVWARGRVEGYAYLDEFMPKEEIEERLSELGVDATSIKEMVPYRFDQTDSPLTWIVHTDKAWFRLDASAGELLQEGTKG